MTIENLLALEEESRRDKIDGKPNDKNYLETNLSESLNKALQEYLQGEKDKISYLDCLADELYGSINADFWAGCITEEQANYLRKKYLYGGEDVND